MEPIKTIEIKTGSNVKIEKFSPNLVIILHPESTLTMPVSITGDVQTFNNNSAGDMIVAGNADGVYERI